jgi:hypothetical protein
MKIGYFYTEKFNAVMRELEKADWNRTRAAIALGISLSSVRCWIREAKACGIHVPDSPKLRHKKDAV